MNKDQVIQAIEDEAKRQGLDPDIALVIAEKESSYDPNARGAAGEYGLFQIMPPTWEYLVDKAERAGLHIDRSEPFDPVGNIRAGVFYLATVLPGELRGHGVATHFFNLARAYNGGAGNVKRGTVSNAANAYGWDFVRKYLARKQALLGVGILAAVGVLRAFR